ncbi:hypothetical protein L596_021435 [Steinernema carpocapsae]|uniref:Uncharacterized protein n=1 Tax=Steinernema carpocapsae TaxID=34508 RepID=A0A4U5MIR9_STECR|nr:hypothetical protein L596_021435 [Steinernema carpocapsae]
MSPTTLRRFSVVSLVDSLDSCVFVFGVWRSTGQWRNRLSGEKSMLCAGNVKALVKSLGRPPVSPAAETLVVNAECVRSNGYVRAHDGKCIRLEDCVEYPKRWANEEYYGGYINATKTQSTLQPVMSEAPSVPIQIPAPDTAQPVPAEPATLSPAASELVVLLKVLLSLHQFQNPLSLLLLNQLMLNLPLSLHQP